MLGRDLPATYNISSNTTHPTPARGDDKGVMKDHLPESGS